MKTKYCIRLLWASMLIWLSGCYNDLGNYDYHDINDIQIEGIHADSLIEKLAFADTLRIIPELSAAQGEESMRNFEYAWKIIPKELNIQDDYDTEQFVVSRERNLEYPVELNAGVYCGFYTVRDRTTGVEWQKDFYLKVTTVVSEGWMVLCQENGKGRMDMITNLSEQEDRIARNLWENLEFQTGKPERLFYHHFPLYMKLFVCESGSYNLDAEDLHPEEGNNLKWSFGVIPDRLQIMTSAYNSNGTNPFWYIIDEQGDLYGQDVYASGALFDYSLNKVSGKTPFKAAPFIGVNRVWDWENSTGVLLYDEDGQRFMEIKDEATYPTEMKFKSTTLFPVKTKMDMIHLESTQDGDCYALLKDPATEKVYYAGIHLSPQGHTQIAYGELKGTALNQATGFAIHSQHPYIFYCAEGKVYRFNMNTDSEATEILNFPGEEITVLKFNPIAATYDLPDWKLKYPYQLVVGSNLTEKDEHVCGIMRRYEVPNLNGPLTCLKEHTQLGKIVDITYREAK